MRITKRQLRRMIREAAGPSEKQGLRDAIFAYMKSSVEQSVPDGKGDITDDHISRSIEDLSSDSKIAAEEYVDADPDRLGISDLGESHVKITKRQLRRIIREEKARLTEYNPAQDPAKRAVGLYFDVNMMKQLDKLMYDMFENAMESARADGLDPDEAYQMVMAGFENLIEEAQMDMRF